LKLGSKPSSTTIITSAITNVTPADVYYGRELQIALSGSAVSKLLSINEERIASAAFTIASLFQICKRGVETKLVLGGAQPDLDETLVQNIAKAQDWLAQIKAGKIQAEVAKTSGTSTRRMQHIIELAFLAPDLTKRVLDGKQPLGFTSEWIKHHSLPSNRQEQRALFATL